jgi:sarcosine oxidase subunit gamma
MEGGCVDSLSTGAFAAHLVRLETLRDASSVVDEWEAASIASVITRVSGAASVAETLRKLAVADMQILDIGPGNWLVIASRRDTETMGTLQTALGDAAQVFDVSSGYALLTLQGRDALALLQKGIFVDLDRALASDGASCSSLVAHIAVTAWRLSADRFAVAVPRSYANSFWHWLEAASAADGIRPSRVP